MVALVLLDFGEVLQGGVCWGVAVHLKTVHIDSSHPPEDGTSLGHVIPVFLRGQVSDEFFKRPHQELGRGLKIKISSLTLMLNKSINKLIFTSVG